MSGNYCSYDSEHINYEEIDKKSKEFSVILRIAKRLNIETQYIDLDTLEIYIFNEISRLEKQNSIVAGSDIIDHMFKQLMKNS